MSMAIITVSCWSRIIIITIATSYGKSDWGWDRMEWLLESNVDWLVWDVSVPLFGVWNINAHPARLFWLLYLARKWGVRHQHESPRAVAAPVQILLWLKAGKQTLEPLSSESMISVLKPSLLMISCKIHCILIFFSFLLSVPFHLCRDDAVSKAPFRLF